MSWDPDYCGPNGCVVTEQPCQAAIHSQYSRGERTHHLSPTHSTGDMVCIYCLKSAKEIDEAQNA